ncbi:hypothetical protein ACIBI9_27440 [Nonomuraea sp. NPDC050451]|uniref:hypothetical protein n=1 Tax=Nonomuraea sp. NPDC050451 TaxID=3364364 RepID=UPI0037B067D2
MRTKAKQRPQTTVPNVSERQEQYLRLARLAWELRELGLIVRLELMPGQDVRAIVPGARNDLKLMARRIERRWYIVWGRGRDQRDLAEEGIALRVAEVAR